MRLDIRKNSKLDMETCDIIEQLYISVRHHCEACTPRLSCSLCACFEALLDYISTFIKQVWLMANFLLI